jgi:predicted metalloprotease with PDZ domain
VKLGFIDKNYTGSGKQYLGGYLTSNYGVAEPEFIFLAPNDIEKIEYEMKVIFDLPEGWKSTAYWTKVGENEYIVDPKINNGDYSNIEFANGAIAFGDLYKEEATIGNTFFTAAILGYSKSDAERMASLAKKNFEYYTTMIGPTPTKGFIIVFIPAKIEGNYVNPYNENIGGFFTRIYATNIWHTSDQWWRNISHPMFHNWTAYIDCGFWFGEGFTSYYELKALTVIGMNSEEEINRELANSYLQYKNEILGSSNDISIKQASDIYPTNHSYPYDFITYKKGSLFAFILDEEITRITNGNKSLDDVLRLIFQQKRHLDSELLIEDIREVTGEDLTQIVNDYLMKNNPLPFYVKGRNLFIDIPSI